MGTLRLVKIGLLDASELHFYQNQVYMGSDLCFVEVTNSIQTGDANKTIQGNVEIVRDREKAASVSMLIADLKHNICTLYLFSVSTPQYSEAT